MRTRQSLNGWWDFCPDLSEAGRRFREPGTPPADGWTGAGILVPGSWTRGGQGETGPAPREERPWDAWRLFDSYGYPPAWDATCTAWYRTRFELEALPAGTRCFLLFGGILRRSWIFVNGTCVGQTTDGMMPSEHDVTGAIRPASNELLVYVTDYERNAAGKTFVPVGADQMVLQKGIWQDVELEVRPDVFVDDVTIRTSTRRNELAVTALVRNLSNRPRTVRPSLCVEDTAGVRELRATGDELVVQPGETRRVELVRAWTSYRPWTPWTPTLYRLLTRLHEGDRPVDIHRERFGFREVWLEGHRLMLNGSPIHLAGEWRHNHSLDFFRPEYVRQWYGMLKDLNMNYIRTHTYPHPRVVLDIADEMGVLVAVEAGWHFGGGHAVDDERLWQGASRHVRNIIRRDKNHPSVILWSVGNECRWNPDQAAVVRNMPRLRALYEELDPTRAAYHEGDSSLWDERTQPIISRHYGLECTGEGWWDRQRPLHVGELGKWHYGQPIDNTVWGDDRVFASFRECHRAIALEAADIIEQARANEVLCLFPWNLSGLDNFRPWPEEHTFSWPDVRAAGVKPLRSAPYGSEFAWWEPQGKGYLPGVGFAIVRHALRPVALVVRERLNRVFSDQAIAHTVTVINDSGAPVRGTLSVRVLVDGDAMDWRCEERVTLDTGCTQRMRVEIPPLALRAETDVIVVTELGDRAQAYDSVRREVRVTPAESRARRWPLALAAFGDGSMDELLAAHSVDVTRLDTLAGLSVSDHPLLLIERDALRAGSRQNRELDAYLRNGGKAVILEQSAALVAGMPVDTQPAERVHMRGDPRGVLDGLDAEDFAFWGEAPYGLANSDAWVVVRPFLKPTRGSVRVLLESGFGDFGEGGMHGAALVDVRVGAGLALCCQLRLTDKAASHPSALGTLRRLLFYAREWEPSPQTPVCATPGSDGPLAEMGALRSAWSGYGKLVCVAGAELDEALAAALEARVANGKTALVVGIDAAAAAALSKAFGIALETVDLGPIYNLVRAAEDPLLDGIGNQELYWLDRAHYGPRDAGNRPITRGLLRCEGAQVLLSSESESCWREFYTQDAKSERLRMPVITHYLWNGPREHAAGMLRVPHGDGQLILCQVPIEGQADYPKARRFWVQLLRNFGVTCADDVLGGPCVEPGLRRSDGQPRQADLLLDPGDAVEKTVHAAAVPAEYRLPNHALRSSFAWRTVGCEDGAVRVPPGTARALIASQVTPGRPRRMSPVAGGLPNPNQQTLLDLAGSGRAAVSVNGRAPVEVTLGAECRATVADVELERYWNSVVIAWEPGGGETLRLRWRNRQGQPETEFEFLP